MKRDEKDLILALVRDHRGPFGHDPGHLALDEIAASVGVTAARAEEIMQRWCDRDHWEIGVNIRDGWFTPDGFRKADALAGRHLLKQANGPDKAARDE